MGGYVGESIKPTALYDSYTQAQANGLLDNKVDRPSLTSVSGTAVFTNSDNNINLTGIGGVGLEVGDVIEVTGSANNDKLFTVEVLSDVDNIIVNAAHAGGTTTKSLVDETVSATVTLVAKWFNASDSLGRGWCQVVRTHNVDYTNNTKRAFLINIYHGGNYGYSSTLLVDGDGIVTSRTQASSAYGFNMSCSIPRDSSYSYSRSNNGDLRSWKEFR